VKIARFLPLLLAVILGACATTTPDVLTSYNPSDGLRTDLINDNLLDGGEPGQEMLWLNASRVFKTPTKYSYYLEVTYAAKATAGYLDIGPGQTLVIVADGKEMKFGGNGSQFLRKSKGGVLNENALYVAQAADLRALAAAKTVVVRVSGKNGLVQREFKPVNSERFRKFTNKFVTEE
jgi:hypothetical protein